MRPFSSPVFHFKSHPDILLKEVSQAFAKLADEQLRPLLRDEDKPVVKDIARELLLLQWRARDAFQDFGDFYCIRLLLDEQSTLASYFIDIFVQLHWMLNLLRDYHPSTCLESLRGLLRPVAGTCLLLHAAHRMLPRQEDSSSSEEFKRAGRIGRMFSSNKLHCRMRQLGFVNLDQPGQSLVSLKEELGSGAFATVYKGVFEADPVEKNEKMIIGEPVAVKMFTSGPRSESRASFGSQLLQSMEEVSHLLSTDLQFLTHYDEVVGDARLRIELGRLVSVRHPNIVTPRGYIGKRPQGESGLVMDLMDESLHDFLGKVKGGDIPPLTELDMLDLMLEIAKGMRFLHECNLMHRDLKPRNVLLRYATDHYSADKLLEVKLADFGLTKLYGFASGGHTAPVGTSCYMAPELWGDAQHKMTYEEKVDVFSYGTTCFNILIGNPDAMAFATSREGFYEAVKKGRWKHWVRGIDKNLDYMVKLVARCWETDPSMRPTFATVCLLLQHSFQCLSMCPRFNVNAFSFYQSRQHPFSNDIERYQKFRFSLKQRYVQHCKSILCEIQRRHEVVGLDVIERILGEFEALKLPPPIPESYKLPEVDISDFAKDFRVFVEAQKSVNVKRFAFPWPKLVTKKPSGSEKREDYRMPSSKNGLIENCLKTLDPLSLIKGLVCHSSMSYDFGEDTPETFPKYQNFDFRNDDAHCDLQVDASIVPLLMGFWSLKL